MVDRGLECRSEDDPECEAGNRPDERGDRPDERAVPQQDEANVLLRRADGGEHAELAETSLRDDCKACGGDQRGQSRKTVATENIANVSAAPLTSLPRSMEPAKAERDRSPSPSAP